MKASVYRSIEKALNAYLRLDPESETRLKTMENKMVKIHLTGMEVVFFLFFNKASISMTSQSDFVPNTTITGTPLCLLHLAISNPSQRQPFFSEDVKMEGDIELGEAMTDLFDKMSIDYEEILSQYVGDSPANFLGSLVRKTRSWFSQSCDTTRMNVSEYLHEEIQLFPPREALEDFFKDVDQIRMNVDRLEARMQVLKAAYEGKQA